ncbi:uncharacterized protein LOC135368579 [Ornithodoros turicata]|uniref:uncharacterized protein LOC135368579 n=1 Tax=Ornithodoros turicata TaxID=34597 RepID=UPI003138E15B
MDGADNGNTGTAGPPAKRARRPNFSEREIEALVAGYQVNKTIIDATGITESVFAVSGIKRTTAEVKKKWTDYKSANKKKGASVIRSLGRTGGGAADVPPLTPLEERVVGTLDTSTVAGIDGSFDIGVGGPNVVLDYDGMQRRGSTSSTTASVLSEPVEAPEEEARVHQTDTATPLAAHHRGASRSTSRVSSAEDIAQTQRKIEGHLAALVDILGRILAIQEYKYGVKTLPAGAAQVNNRNIDENVTL